MRLVEGHIGQGRGVHLLVQASSTGQRLVVTTDARGLECRAGAGLLREAADRFGLTSALCGAVDRVRSYDTHALTPLASYNGLLLMLKQRMPPLSQLSGTMCVGRGRQGTA